MGHLPQDHLPLSDLELNAAVTVLRLHIHGDMVIPTTTRRKQKGLFKVCIMLPYASANLQHAGNC